MLMNVIPTEVGRMMPRKKYWYHNIDQLTANKIK